MADAGEHECPLSASMAGGAGQYIEAGAVRNARNLLAGQPLVVGV